MNTIRLAFHVSLLCAATATGRGAEDVAFFESKVRPLLVERCHECHGEKKQKGGLRLDSKSGWQKGGESGAALVPGKPEESLLIKAVSYLDKDLQMPPKKQLTPDEVAVLKEWIRQGAHDPRVAEVAAIAHAFDDGWAVAFQKRLDWWSLKPLRKTQPPVVKDAAWAREPVDRFIRAALDAAALAPAAAAEPEVLLRRLSVVLTGLPPTPEQRGRFLQHWQTDATAAYEKLVDEMLASPHYGEHFARHWMDVVRYTDTYGYEWDIPAKGSWEYRDYLIRVFNGDVGYNQFVTEQLAGDLLAQPRINGELGINESLIGPMFYHMGEHRHGNSLQFNGIHQEMVNNKIDAFSKAFLGTTVACARCHNHKLEAVSQRDYYALAAVFMTPRWTARAVDAPGKNDAPIAKLKELRGAIRREMAVPWLAAAQQEGAWSPEILQRALEVPEVPEGKAAPVVKKKKTAVAPATPNRLDDVAYPILRLIESGDDVEKLWRELIREWQDARALHLKANAGFTVLADFREPNLPEHWTSEGDGMKHGYVEDGTPLIALEGDTVVARLLPRGWHTHALSSKLPGALRMPPHVPAPGKWVSVQFAGGGFGCSVQAIENAFLHEGVTFPEPNRLEWKSIVSGRLSNGVTQVTTTFATASLNPVFPGRTDVVPGLPKNDLGYDKRSWVSITGIVKHDKPGTPQDMLEHFAPLFEGTPKTPDEAWARIGDWLTGAVQRWSEGKPQAGDVRVVDWLLTKKLLPNHAGKGSALAGLLAEYRRVEQGIAFPRTAMSMDERECVRVKYPLNVRGDVDAPGELIAPDFLKMFAGKNNVAKSRGSGRLELAESLVQTEHPLTSRVYVNRVWQWIFGAGIVDTPDDFGRLGGKPSHPELLDYLAREFMREGWSTKTLVRRLVLSQTFRQSGTVSERDEAARERDPDNRLLHHYPTRRLEAESIRDSLLAVSGRLDPQLYGRPIDPPRVVEDATKRLFSGPLDGDGRRSLYLKMAIMAPPVFLAGFNLPDLKLPTGKRDVTNVPAQALVMLNDPLVRAMAKHWAAQLIKTPNASPEERVRAMFVRAFGREPQEGELKRWTAAWHDFAASTGGELMNDEAAWAQLAHALFNTKEFIYFR